MADSVLRRVVWLGRFLFATCVLAFAGCQNEPSPAPKIDVNPARAAEAAFELYDVDGDRVLSGAEIGKCPGMQKAKKDFDQNGDGKVSLDELETRITYWSENLTAMVHIYCSLALDGRPLSGATVRFVPEPFLADGLYPAEGVTNERGSVEVGVSGENLPADFVGINAIQLGLYRVEISHPSKDIPAKYNTETTLGQEVVPTTQDALLRFDLQSR